ncbi:hypothetical protein SAMN05443665_104622 [Actinomadura meyerae]|uniref:Uncharacterized protein n=1 Tax=Actinomadura meyerae TaxID=240840 RepID=A0A239NRC0_9ACTN|nr:hypothetical protein [Actinomadura meyerae]SNT56938.1 hypothetical protein SAMN05443665_104622 [Actinomadura meyerae]
MSEVEDAKAHRRLGRLRSTLREREARIAELEGRLAALEASTAVQFGRLVAGAARDPRRGRRLPKELYRLWRRRNAPVAAGSGTGRGGAPPERVDRPEDRLLIANPCDRLIIAGVLGPATAVLLAEHARVIRLYPHDAALVLGSADADLLVVDAAAGEPGGPWAYLGVPGMYDRDLALHEIREIAAARRLPRVLWTGGGAAVPPALAALPWDATATAPARLTEIAGSADAQTTGSAQTTGAAETAPAR